MTHLESHRIISARAEPQISSWGPALALRDLHSDYTSPSQCSLPSAPADSTHSTSLVFRELSTLCLDTSGLCSPGLLGCSSHQLS